MKDIINGQRFGKWTVTDNTRVKVSVNSNHTSVRCTCDCGTISLVRASRLLTGDSKGCHCLAKNYNRTICDNNCVGDLSKSQYGGIKKSALKRGIPWDVSMVYLWKLLEQQEHICKLTHVPIQLSKYITERDNITASLDRIDSSLGYIEGNVQWVHKHVNVMKWTLSQQEFINICKLVAYNN